VLTPNFQVDSIGPETAFGDNLPRLRELKKKYDPNNVFWKWHGFWPATAENLNS